MNNSPIQKRTQKIGFKKKHIDLPILKKPKIHFSPNAPH